MHDLATGVTERVNVTSDGREANDNTFGPVLSFDGRFVAFLSFATNLVPNDGNRDLDAFVHDRVSGETTRVDVGLDGGDAANAAIGVYSLAISSDGRFVAFESDAGNLVADDTNVCGCGGAGCCRDVFVRDLVAATTERVSVGDQGRQSDGASSTPAISSDGRFVAFLSSASNLLSDGRGQRYDVFVRDRVAHTTERVSIGRHEASSSFGGAGNSVTISGDGRFVAFDSGDDALVANDTNGRIDVFVSDRRTRTIERVSVAANGAEANQASERAFISADGRVVAFDSFASNLTPEASTELRRVFVRDRRD